MVKKRDNTTVAFDENKIYFAIYHANQEVPESLRISAPDIYKWIIHPINQVRQGNELSVESIQNIVVRGLMQSGHYDLALKYAIYRYIHDLQRQTEGNSTDEAILSLIQNDNSELATENSNKDIRVVSTQRDYIAGESSRDLTRRKILPPHITKAHDDGVIHVHDTDYMIQPMFNCCLINAKDMLRNGTVMNGKKIESPKSLKVAGTVLTQIIACACSNQYGGQSVDLSVLGEFLAKSRKKIEEMVAGYNMSTMDRAALIHTMVQNELRDSVQTIQYQINTLMTTNGQSPFVTLFLYLREDDPYIEENALIIEEVLRQRIQGIQNEHGVFVTPAFPKLVYALDENNNLSGGKYDYLTRLAVQCTAKRMYPDYISAKKMRENYEGNVFSPMGCRSFIPVWKNAQGEYQQEGRFNQGVVSLNLPQIGILSQGDMDKFWPLLEERCELVREALMVRHNRLLGTVSDVSPIHWQHGAIARLQPGEVIDEYLKNGRASISLGYVGVYETVKSMLGVSHTTPIGQNFALDILKFLKNKTIQWNEECNIGFGLYGTPAESLCYRFARLDRKRFGEIPDITDKGYYTNSYHVDVREQIDAFAKLTFESQFQPISSGGCISYAEIPNMNNNLEALETMVKFIYDNIQYAEFNTKSDFCQECSFDGEIIVNADNEWECPQCGCKDKDKLTVIRRTCGYLGENFWNAGKTEEISKRVTHL